MIAAPGAAVEARVLTNPAGFEDHVSYGVLDAEGEVSQKGGFPPGGVLVLEGLAPPVRVVALVDKDDDGTLTEGLDPAAVGVVALPRPDFLDRYIDGVRYGGGEVTMAPEERVLVQGRLLWTGEDRTPFTDDDVDLGPTAITGTETATVLFGAPGGSSQSVALMRTSQHSPLKGGSDKGAPSNVASGQADSAPGHGGTPPGLGGAGPPGLAGGNPPGLSGPPPSPGFPQTVFEIANNTDGSVSLTALNIGQAVVNFVPTDDTLEFLPVPVAFVVLASRQANDIVLLCPGHLLRPAGKVIPVNGSITIQAIVNVANKVVSFEIEKKNPASKGTVKFADGKQTKTILGPGEADLILNAGKDVSELAAFALVASIGNRQVLRHPLTVFEVELDAKTNNGESVSEKAVNDGGKKLSEILKESVGANDLGYHERVPLGAAAGTALSSDTAIWVMGKIVPKGLTPEDFCLKGLSFHQRHSTRLYVGSCVGFPRGSTTSDQSGIAADDRLDEAFAEAIKHHSEDRIPADDFNDGFLYVHFVDAPSLTHALVRSLPVDTAVRLRHRFTVFVAYDGVPASKSHYWTSAMSLHRKAPQSTEAVAERAYDNKGDNSLSWNKTLFLTADLKEGAEKDEVKIKEVSPAVWERQPQFDNNVLVTVTVSPIGRFPVLPAGCMPFAYVAVENPADDKKGETHIRTTHAPQLLPNGDLKIEFASFEEQGLPAGSATLRLFFQERHEATFPIEIR